MKPDDPSGIALAVMLEMTSSGNDQSKAKEIVRAGHAVCTQSKSVGVPFMVAAMMVSPLEHRVANMRRAQSCRA